MGTKNEGAGGLPAPVEVADPVVTLDLAAGESVSKEFEAGRYMIVKNRCL